MYLVTLTPGVKWSVVWSKDNRPPFLRQALGLASEVLGVPQDKCFWCINGDESLEISVSVGDRDAAALAPRKALAS